MLELQDNFGPHASTTHKGVNPVSENYRSVGEWDVTILKGSQVSTPKTKRAAQVVKINEK